MDTSFSLGLRAPLVSKCLFEVIEKKIGKVNPPSSGRWPPHSVLHRHHAGAIPLPRDNWPTIPLLFLSDFLCCLMLTHEFLSTEAEHVFIKAGTARCILPRSTAVAMLVLFATTTRARRISRNVPVAAFALHGTSSAVHHLALDTEP